MRRILTLFCLIVLAFAGADFANLAKVQAAGIADSRHGENVVLERAAGSGPIRTCCHMSENTDSLTAGMAGETSCSSPLATLPYTIEMVVLKQPLRFAFAVETPVHDKANSRMKRPPRLNI